jgi:hypothetical protein
MHRVHSQRQWRGEQRSHSQPPIPAAAALPALPSIGGDEASGWVHAAHHVPLCHVQGPRAGIHSHGSGVGKACSSGWAAIAKAAVHDASAIAARPHASCHAQAAIPAQPRNARVVVGVTGCGKQHPPLAISCRPPGLRQAAGVAATCSIQHPAPGGPPLPRPHPCALQGSWLHLPPARHAEHPHQPLVSHHQAARHWLPGQGIDHVGLQLQGSGWGAHSQGWVGARPSCSQAAGIGQEAKSDSVIVGVPNHAGIEHRVVQHQPRLSQRQGSCWRGAQRLCQGGKGVEPPSQGHQHPPHTHCPDASSVAGLCNEQPACAIKGN